VIPARREERDDDSLLIQSAESLGRVIGSLQRQMKDRAKRVASPFRKSASPKSGTRKTGTRPAAAASKATGSRKRSASRKTSKKR
jgi:hypothetical protein